MRKVAKTLWIGNAFDARDMQEILSTGITAVVDVAMDEPPIVPTRELICIRFPLIDGSGNSEESLFLAIATVSQLLKLKVPTLVACSAGMSRSPLIAVAGLAIARQTPLDDELAKVVAAGPCDISPTLHNDVRRVAEGFTKI